MKAAFHWEWATAERGFQTALDLNPGDATAHHWYAVYLVGQGRFDEALNQMRRAQDLDPLSLIVSEFAGHVLYSWRRYDEAIEQFHETLKLDPDFGIARVVLGLAYIKKSKYDEAVTVLQRARDLWGENPRVTAALGCAYALSGNRAAAEQILEDLKRASEDDVFPPTAMATIYVGLAESDLALQWLEKAVEQPGEYQIWFAANPIFDPLRSDPRFDDLLERMNLSGASYKEGWVP